MDRQITLVISYRAILYLRSKIKFKMLFVKYSQSIIKRYCPIAQKFKASVQSASLNPFSKSELFFIIFEITI